MEWEVGQLPTDLQVYSIYGADQLYLYYYYQTTYLGDHQSTNWDWGCHHVLLDHHALNLTSPLTSTVADDDKEKMQTPAGAAVGMGDRKLQLAASTKSNTTTNLITPGGATAAAGMAVIKQSASSKADGVQLEELQRYFDRPITEAAKELRVGLTLLKKRCRALGIKRWPHRKIKSITSLIRNLKHLGQPNWHEVRPMLEEQRRMVQAQPHLELSRQAKKIRQKCFKALYYANTAITNKTNRTMTVKVKIEGL